MSNSRSAGRMFLPTRSSPPYSSDQNHRGQRQTPTAPVQSPPSPPITPLTPHNTFFYADDANDVGSSNHETDSPTEYNSELDLSLLEEEVLLRDAVDSERGSEDDQDGKDGRPCGTRSEPSPNTSGSSNKTVIHRPVVFKRSNSVPTRPLKSALVPPTPPSKTPDSERCSRKKARFNEAELTEVLSFRDLSSEPELVRTHTSPNRAELMRRILQRDSFSDHAQSFYTDSSGLHDDPELATAIELFDEVVEELVQVAEEHAEAHEQLAQVAHEVANAIFGERQGKFEDVVEHKAARNNDEYAECELRSVSPGLMRQKSADEDVDESCIADPSIESSQDEGDTVQPDIVLWSDHGELEATQLVPIAEESNSSTETLSNSDATTSGYANKRRASDSQTNLVNLAKLQPSRRRNSMTDFTKLKGRLKLLPASPKASAAGCAVTVCSVSSAESPKQSNLYDNQGARYMMAGDRRPTKMAQTVRSDGSTFQVLWIEPRMSSCSGDVTLIDSSGCPAETFASDGEDAHIARTPSPMDKVKTKLAAWSWLREQGLDSEHGGPNWIPLLSCHDDASSSPPGMHSPPSDEPFAPPNTERPSGASSAKHSAPHSPGPEDISVAEDEEEDHPLELKFKATPAKPLSTIPPSLKKSQGDYLSIPVQQFRSKPDDQTSQMPIKPISRELSNLPADETHFKTHKNSLVLLNKRKEEGKLNQQLMNSRDSIVLARSKLDSNRPRSAPAPKSPRSRLRALSPIKDASPPDPRAEATQRALEKFVEASKQKEEKTRPDYVDGAYPDDHVGCPICETERPRWFAANCKNGHFV